MTLDWGLDPKTPASKFGAFIENDRTIGGGYSTLVGNKCVSCQIGDYELEYEFIKKDECRVKATNGSSIKETIKVSYIHATEPDFLKLFTNSCGLARKLTNSK